MQDRELEALLEDLESDRVERKESPSDRKKLAQAICAFANDLPGHGLPGVLFVGARDDGKFTGLDITDKLLRDLSALRDDGRIQPLPSMTVEKRQLPGGDVAVVTVQPAVAPPVRFEGRTWIRIGPRRGIASAEEERRLAERRLAADLPFDLRPRPSASLADLDLEFFERVYLPAAVAPEILERNQRSVEDQLKALRFLDPQEHPTVLGLLVLGHDPRTFVPGAYIQFLRFDGTKNTDAIRNEKTIWGPLSKVVQRIDELLDLHIQVAVSITEGPVEIRRPDYPLAALQQLVRNAILHRTYELSNAPVRCYWYSDRIEIQNPGGPYGQVTVENFGQPSTADYRNPHLAEAMRVLGFVQRFGVGIGIAREELERNKNPPLKFHVEPTRIVAEVHAVPGQFVGRPVVLEERESRLDLGEDRREEYLSNLWSYLSPLTSLGQGYSATLGQDIPLAAVYTSLDVTAEAVASNGGPGRDLLSHPVTELRGDPGYLEHLRARIAEEAAARESPDVYRRRYTAVEAAAAAPRLVLTGPAGSGKSTFARYLALCMAGEALGRSEADLKCLNDAAGADASELSEFQPWPHGALVPIFVELREFVRSVVFPAAEEKGQASHLLSFFDVAAFSAKVGRCSSTLRHAMVDGSGLLILDGLDETPAAAASRNRLKEVIVSCARQYPLCRILVTSRPYAYAKNSEWRLDGAGFEEVSLAPFDLDKIRRYVESWYFHLAARGQVGNEQAERQSAALVGEIEATGYLLPLARRPLMLSMMADLYAMGGGRFRGGRAAFYERSVELLLDRWNETRDVVEGGTVAEILGMDVGEIRVALERLAYEVHRARGSEAANAVEIHDQELWEALGRERSRERLVDERRVMEYLHQRSGILVAESSSLYRFPHRSYQEYLAACYLVRTRFPGLLLGEIRSDPTLWREVLLLAIGKVAETPFMAWVLLEGLVDKMPETSPGLENPRYLRALYAGLAIREYELWREIQIQDESKLERVRAWLEQTLATGALSPIDRAEAGQVLGTLGDHRTGIGLHKDGLPDIEWVEVPAGPFVMGSAEGNAGPWDGEPQLEVELPGYLIGRYPITNAQYRVFVEDGGYTETWRRCWTEAGWKWNENRSAPDDDLSDVFLLDNHPRVNVCWYEAHAFCRWLGQKLGHEVRLPTDAEWEKAARGTDSRTYPWGSDFDESRCNSRYSAIGHTTAVGSFPSGASPYGVLDASGNVWEWCSTKWRRSYEEPADEGSEGTAARVWRGGSFRDEDTLLCCAARFGPPPHERRLSGGFRVATATAG